MERIAYFFFAKVSSQINTGEIVRLVYTDTYFQRDDSVVLKCKIRPVIIIKNKNPARKYTTISDCVSWHKFVLHLNKKKNNNRKEKEKKAVKQFETQYLGLGVQEITL